ncbi:MAG: M14 family zinc carboxypeptidase [Gemmatimonadales bacterium]
MPIPIRVRSLSTMLAAVVALAGAIGCGGENQTPAAAAQEPPSSLDLSAGLELARRFRVDAIPERRFNHATYWKAVEPSLVSPVFRTEEIGRSVQGRAIRAVTYGTGPTTVLLWSQMHGDESTASMALADIFRFLAEAEGDSLRERLRSQLTVAVIPMLNPDGAEIFQRENAWGIDINRDARRLSTPEAQALKSFRDRFNPQFGFNLHDQNARSRVGQTGRQAGIALLAPPFDAERSYNEVRTRARLVAATLAKTFETELAGRVAKYDDGFNPRAFGDLMQQWGTSTVLIESGALPDDPQKQRLRALHVAGILTALDAIATGGYQRASAAWYDDLPFNAGGASDLLVVGGKVVLPGGSPFAADVAINFDDAVARTGGRIREVGDLQTAVAIDTIDATGLYLHPTAKSLRVAPRGGGAWLRIGAAAQIEVRRGPEASSPLVRRVEGPTDAP